MCVGEYHAVGGLFDHAGEQYETLDGLMEHGKRERMLIRTTQLSATLAKTLGACNFHQIRSFPCKSP
jgi:hypothetical protein